MSRLSRQNGDGYRCLHPPVLRGRLRRVVVVAALAAAALPAAALPAGANRDGPANLAPGSLPVRWDSGGPDCSVVQQDFQIHAYNADVFILRESGCVHAEKPFLYLIFGRDKALLLDTGAGPDTDPATGRAPGVRAAVDFAIDQWLRRNNRTSIHLVVAHLHSHPDHIWGDGQFQKRPHTTVVPPNDVDALRAFFGIQRWPTDIVEYDLGQRVVDVIPIPGHDETSLAVYDRRTGLLFTGDTLYPGRLFINVPDHEVFAASIERLVDFTRTRPVAHVLGTHIEQRGPYIDYPIGNHFAPDETSLQLGRAHLLELREATALRNPSGAIVQKAYRDFTICGAYPTCVPINR